jgi:hypothetical protein
LKSTGILSNIGLVASATKPTLSYKLSGTMLQRKQLSKQSSGIRAAVIARKDTGWAADQSVRLLECLMKTIKSTRRLAQKFKLLTGLVPITNNSTRWNSYYRMFERALACHETLSEWQWKYPELRKFALHKEDWIVIQKTYDFLKQFLVLTKETEGDESTLEQVSVIMRSI